MSWSMLLFCSCLALQGPGAAAAVQDRSQVSPQAKREFFKNLDRCLPKRARYRIHKRRLVSKGWTGKVDLESRIEACLSTAKGGRQAIEALWKGWLEEMKEKEVLGQRSDALFTVAWQPDLTIRTYEHPVRVPKSPGPVLADLTTANFGMRRMTVKGSGTCLQLLHRTTFGQEKPLLLLRPWSEMQRHEGRLIGSARWTGSQARGLIRYHIGEPKMSMHYLVHLDARTRLPRAVCASARMASVYAWTRVAKGQMWLDSVIQVRQRGTEWQVDRLEIGRVQWNPKEPIQIDWPRPTRLFDTRAGRKRWHDFEVRLLPRSLRAIPWPALTSDRKKPEPGKR